MGLLVALPTTVSVTLYAVIAVGLKVTLSLQVRPGATGVEQLPRAMVNGAPAVAELMMSGLVPVFVTVMVLVVFVLILLAPNAKLAGVENVVRRVTPVPLNETMLGEPAALWAMLTVADFAPAVVGLNLTLMVHDPAGVTVPQLFVTTANCVGFVPASVTPETTRLAVPLLLTVIVCAAESVPVFTEPKASEAVETTAIGAATTPVPLRVTLEGDPAALWMMATVADFTPVVAGLKITSIVQEPSGKTVPQVFAVIVNSPKLAPVNAKPDTRRLAFPVLVTVTTCATELDPAGCDPNASEAVDTCANGAGTGLVLAEARVSNVPWLSV